MSRTDFADASSHAEIVAGQLAVGVAGSERRALNSSTGPGVSTRYVSEAAIAVDRSHGAYLCRNRHSHHSNLTLIECNMRQSRGVVFNCTGMGDCR